MKCVIADDNKIIRALLLRIMSNLNFEVIEAEDGEEVVEICQLQEPDLVIMELVLPLLDGLNALYQIRASKGIKQPKVLICSSITDPLKIKETITNGADEYVMKPFDEEIVVNKLDILGLR